MKTTDKILERLKLHGPQTANELAAELGLTSMGVRQHLLSLEAQGLLGFEDRSEGRGRPARYWCLTDASQGYFGDRHEDLTLRLIESVKVIFGDEGLDKLIGHREQASAAQYAAAMAGCDDLRARLEALAAERSREGYMAEVQEDERGLWLLENHCPICAAARECQNFCRSELKLFSELLGPGVSVSREEHILGGARRCAYLIKAD
ncbi:transcriptional regulator [Shewanella cyperi]|uniref:Transcriptional regulator n=1 Tax=Shewanella cyperi TaxID=2814292 RepID=A0A974XLQ9_9GAMM|nr:metalloregulator ArsR/SmtB family transcription factor [Shewanella cyperi]QSX30715.1 transcriptional regulator [Shewanella cyperi]